MDKYQKRLLPVELKEQTVIAEVAERLGIKQYQTQDSIGMNRHTHKKLLYSEIIQYF